MGSLGFRFPRRTPGHRQCSISVGSWAPNGRRVLDHCAQCQAVVACIWCMGSRRMILFLYVPSEVIYMVFLIRSLSVNTHQNECNRLTFLSSKRASALEIRKRAPLHDTQGLPSGGPVGLKYKPSSTAVWHLLGVGGPFSASPARMTVLEVLMLCGRCFDILIILLLIINNQGTIRWLWAHGPRILSGGAAPPVPGGGAGSESIPTAAGACR